LGRVKKRGEWGGALRKAGYDFLIVEGKTEGPTYVVINDDRVEIRSAEKLKGKTTSEKDELIKEELKDKKFETVVIGPAGEKLVRFANITVGNRAFGRCGAGAVMGSKNLLSIAVKGSGEIPIANPDGFSSICKTYNKKVLETAGKNGMAPGGTTGDMPKCDEAGDFPTKNWRSNSWGKGKELYDHFKNENLVGAAPCYRGCVLRCGRVCRVDSGKWMTPQHGGASMRALVPSRLLY
jgi:aldehyde:ferredoxin oxidoreductase